MSIVQVGYDTEFQEYYCEGCGAEVLQDEKYCETCGSNLDWIGVD